MLNPFEAAQTAKNLARDLGFDLVGIAPVQPSAYAQQYRQWIADGKQGDMDYLARNLDERLDLSKKFPWAQSVLALALSYYHPSPTDTPHDPAPPAGKIARYAWGRDYHKVIEAKLKKLEKALRAQFEPRLAPSPLEIRAYCDTGPVLERELAARAGLGWVGKNTLLLHPRHGSYFALAELITSLPMRPDTPLGTHCGTCTRCIDACPTGAISPFSVDATKCISYHTLENRGPIDDQWHAAMKAANFLVGCDICQEVCPFNRQPLPTREPDFVPKSPAPAMPLEEILAWQEQEWDIATRGRAFRRAKHPMWRRNARILLPEDPAE